MGLPVADQSVRRRRRAGDRIGAAVQFAGGGQRDLIGEGLQFRLRARHTAEIDGQREKAEGHAKEQTPEDQHRAGRIPKEAAQGGDVGDSRGGHGSAGRFLQEGGISCAG